DEHCAGLEITLGGPTLRFNCATQVVLTGAELQATLDDTPVSLWEVISIKAGQTLKLGKVTGAGARSYLLVKNGFDCPDYLGAKATFTLGQFGGHGGRALRAGDVLRLFISTSASRLPAPLSASLRPVIANAWTLRVIYGPH